MGKFKVGDKVKKKSGDVFSNGECVVTVSRLEGVYIWFKETGTNMEEWGLELVERKNEVKYEDKWNLNDGSVEIPDDAEKLMNPEGTSVVAFRYVKKPKVVIHVRHVIQELGCVNEPYYTTSNGKSSNAVAKLTFLTTDGELTDIQWEKM
jgi:hypothetical protein